MFIKNKYIKAVSQYCFSTETRIELETINCTGSFVNSEETQHTNYMSYFKNEQPKIVFKIYQVLKQIYKNKQLLSLNNSII